MCFYSPLKPNQKKIVFHYFRGLVIISEVLCEGKNTQFTLNIKLQNIVNEKFILFKQLNDELPASEGITKLNAGMRGKKLGAGDLKKASRDLLPGLMKKMKTEIENKRLTHEERKAVIKEFSKVGKIII